MSRFLSGLRNVFLTIWYFLIDLIWWVRYRTTNRNHVIKLNTLKPGWHDADERMLHAMFHILADYIEKEEPDGIIDWECADEYRKAWEEIMFLYDWWKTKRPLRYNQLPDFPHVEGDFLKKIFNPDHKKELDEWNRIFAERLIMLRKFEREDDEMMVRLVKVRGHLWT